jgi:hypothetical protein
MSKPVFIAPATFVLQPKKVKLAKSAVPTRKPVLLMLSPVKRKRA